MNFLGSCRSVFHKAGFQGKKGVIGVAANVHDLELTAPCARVQAVSTQGLSRQTETVSHLTIVIVMSTALFPN